MGFDIALVVLVLLSFFFGYKRGLIYMVFFLIGITLGVFASLQLSHITTAYLDDWFSIADRYMPILSLVCSFLIVFIAVHLISQILEKFIQIIQLNFFNKLAGGAVGAVIAFGVVSIAYWYADNLSIVTDNATANSQLYSLCNSFAPMFIEEVSAILPYAKNVMEHLQTMFENFALENLQQSE